MQMSASFCARSFARDRTGPLLDIPHLAELPAIRWRLRNLEQLSRRQPERFRALAVALDDRLEQ